VESEAYVKRKKHSTELHDIFLTESAFYKSPVLTWNEQARMESFICRALFQRRGYWLKNAQARLRRPPFH
jgi:hypothetical protein